MNKDQIKSLISAKIAGQGNQVDSGGALDEILNAIVDAIPEEGPARLLIFREDEMPDPTEYLEGTIISKEQTDPESSTTYYRTTVDGEPSWRKIATYTQE